MKAIRFKISTLVLMAGVAALFPAHGRTFTDSKGRSIEAELVARSGANKIVIQRAGKEFTVPIAMFSADDQIFISEWITKNPNAVRMDVKLNYFVDLKKGKVSSELADKYNRDERLKTMPQVYDFSIRNVGSHNLTDLRVVYQVLIEDYVDTNGNYRSMSYYNQKAKKKIQRIRDEVKIGDLAIEKRVDIQKPFNIEKYIDRDYGKVAVAAQDKVIGIWIRVYRQDKLLDEYKRAVNGNLRGISWEEGAEDESTVTIR